MGQSRCPSQAGVAEAVKPSPYQCSNSGKARMLKKMDRNDHEAIAADIDAIWRRLREFRAERGPRTPEQIRKSERACQQRRAWDLAHRAKRCGRIKEQPCAHCGSAEKLNMHHEDYSKPLEVIWLCRKCHIFTHTSARPNNKT